MEGRAPASPPQYLPPSTARRFHESDRRESLVTREGVYRSVSVVAAGEVTARHRADAIRVRRHLAKPGFSVSLGSYYCERADTLASSTATRA